MYSIHVPVMVTAPTFQKEAILDDLRACGAGRIFLAIPPLTSDMETQNAINQKLADAIRFFKKNGIETGVWFWAFWVEGDNAFTSLTGVNGVSCDVNRCPADENFLAYMQKQLAAVAEMGPDMIQFDDDLRFGFIGCGFGCTCKNHRAMMGKMLGEELPEGNLFSLLFGGKPNKYRSAFLRANGDSIREFARRAREAVDSVNPEIRLGQCACLGTFDLDGTDPFEISRILAGKTKPFLRLIGAPYWAVNRNWGNRLEDVIELERLERSWYSGNDIEIFSEGDVYPRPRFHVPASYLELFDAALRADGTLDGILKYMMDYTSSRQYERGYMTRHIADEPMKQRILSEFSGKTAVGVRVYQSMKTAEDSDFSLCPENNESIVQNRFFAIASRMLATSTVPTTYYGTGCAGIAFGENARHLPENAFEKPLILDILAAKILMEQGHDVGLASVGKRRTPHTEHFPETGEYVNISAAGACTFDVKIKEGAIVRASFTDGEDYPYCITYENADGEKYLIYNFDADIASEDIWRSYAHTALLHSVLENWNCGVPAKCLGNPDLYLLCKDGNDGTRSLILCNCFADAVRPLTVTLDTSYKNAEFFGCTGYVHENELRIDSLSAFAYCFVTLRQ